MPIVRGWRQYLYDANGRPYLDVINNVAGVGHSHPRIANAASRQLRLLNTNSRFLYESMTAYAERIVALLPAELDTVFLVNSGSEACDLAVQLARVYTARRDVVALAGAYHGWTSATYELCSSPADNPGWRTTIPSFVHVAEQPDPYRGRFGAQPEPYVRSITEACARASEHGGVAGFISEPLLGNQGAVTPPGGYLKSAYAAVREHGGVCIADEIQVGYGRTGHTFWAFEYEEVVPDIVVAAKAAGNGHPLGIVACRKEIAEVFGRRASFFSSTGGGPVTCEIGLAVLDVMRDERLQENAAAVGARLRQELEDLARRHPLIGAVHGRGLYLGVDLVRDRATKEPCAGAAHRTCERMRELGVIVQPTGDAANVLKVKPPLCITAEDADFFTAALDKALGEVEQVLL
jgi:4-aminobutyrate aminotransferase-like enzyme